MSVLFPSDPPLDGITVMPSRSSGLLTSRIVLTATRV
jgi:hypothetical protein